MAKDTKKNILEISRKLFSDKGFEGCSVGLIADKAKVNKATIYYYFKNKSSLYEQVLEDNLNCFLERVKLAVVKEDTAEKKLGAFATSYASNFSSNKMMAPLMLRELASDGNHLTDKTRAILNEIIVVVGNILKEGNQSGTLRKTIPFLPYFMIVGSMNIYTSTQKMRNKFQGQKDEFGFSAKPQEVAKELTAIVLNGLRTNKEFYDENNIQNSSNKNPF